MDADDLMPPECGRGLRGLVRLHPNMDAAFHIHVRIPASPGEFGAQVVDHVKLFPNRPDLRFEHRIHEQILPAIRRAELAVHPTDLYVVHQNYDRSEEGQAKKRERDFRLLELDLQDHPEHPFPLFNLGMTYLYATGEYEVAAHYLRRSLARSDPRDSIVRKAYGMLVECRTGQGDWDGAVRDLEEGRSHYPHDAELLYRAGQVYQQQRRWSEARLALEELVVGAEKDHFRSVDLGLRTYKGRHELALFYGRMGDSAHSESALRELVGEFPDYLPAQLDLAETLGREGNTAEARVLLARLAEAPGVGPEAQRLLARFGAPALAA
jgi:tetratricopeptide (TPR) repeat protein